MIYYLSHKEIEKARWDECINNAANSIVYGYSWYLDIVSPCWDALVLNDYEAVMPLTWKRKWLIKYLIQPMYTQQSGIFAKNPDAGMINAFLQKISCYFSYADIYLNEKNLSGFPKGSTVTERKTQFLSMDRGYDLIYKGYHPKLRKNLRMAKESGLTTTNEVSAGDVAEMFMSIQGPKLKINAPKNRKLLTELLEKIQENNMGDVRGVQTKEGNLCAAIFFVTCGKRIIYFKGATTDAGKELRATHLLLDKCIQSSAGNYDIFDFGGSVLPGIENFFKTFGAKDLVYYQYKENHLPFPLRWIKN